MIVKSHRCSIPDIYFAITDVHVPITDVDVLILDVDVLFMCLVLLDIHPIFTRFGDLSSRIMAVSWRVKVVP